MEERQLAVFIESTVNFFDISTGNSAELGSPELRFGNMDFQDLVGQIEISGISHGQFLASCSQDLLDELLQRIGETELNEQNRRDVLGEMASIIASNCRREFGRNFRISVPRVYTPEELPRLADDVLFTLPIRWQGYDAVLVIQLGEEVAA